MIKSRLFFIFIIFLMIPAPALAGNTKAEILSALRGHFANLTDFQALYTRKTKSPAMESYFKSETHSKASGIIYFKKPDKLRLDQRKPDLEQLVTNGKTIWWYIPAENLVQRFSNRDLVAELAPLLDFINGLADLEETFDVSLVPDRLDGSFIELKLVPKRAKNGEVIIIFVDPETGILQGFRFISSMQEITTFQLMDLEINIKIKDDFFNFQIPPGTEIADN